MSEVLSWAVKYAAALGTLLVADRLRGGGSKVKAANKGPKGPESVDEDKLILGVELGGTTCVAAIAKVKDLTKVLDRVEVATTTPDDTLPRIRDWAVGKKDEICAIGIASFGPIQLDKSKKDYGTIIDTTPKVAFRGANIVKQFEDFGVPIHFETDVNAPAYAEMKYGGHEGADSCVYVTVGTGVGVGAVVNGYPVHGLMHTEGGHYNPRRKDEDLYPGWSDIHPHCLESLISSRAIAERAGVDAKDLKDLPDDHPVWEDIAYYLGELCATATYMLSPHVIVLGGGVLKREVLMNLVRKNMTSIINGYIPSPRITDEPEKYVCRSKFGADSGLIGSLALGELALAALTE